MQHETGEGEEMQPHQGCRQPLVVTRQTPKARRPGETAFDHPAAGEKHEAAPDLGRSIRQIGSGVNNPHDIALNQWLPVTLGNNAISV